MAAKRILLLDGLLLTAHYWSGGHLKVEGEFGQGPAGVEALATYLKKHGSSLFFLLADVAEEGFQLDDVPYVQGRDRTALLQRRLSQHYHSTPLSTAISLGRGAIGRRDEKVLFAALTRIETFAPWLDALRNAEANLAGVYSVPLVLAEWGARLLGNRDPVLFVSVTRGGVRQSFLDRGKLHFSRLSQLATRSLDEIGRTSATESAKIYQYLVAQRQIPRGVPLRTVVLAKAAQIPALQEFCRNTDEIQFEFMEIEAAARQHGLKGISLESNADNLFMHFLAIKPPAQQFAPANERHLFKLWQIRFAMTSVAWVVFAGCVLFAGKAVLNVHQLQDSTEAIKALTVTETRRYHDILEGLPKISVTPDNLRALMGRIDALQQRSPAIDPLLTYLSLALNEEPTIEVTRLAWKMGDGPDPHQKGGEGPRRAGPAPATSTTTGENWAVIEIQARLPLGLITDRRAQMQLIERFADRLRGPQTDVRVISRPFDIESDKALKSTGRIGDVQLADAPRFSVRIARQL